jgi:hypothetical protein
MYLVPDRVDEPLYVVTPIFNAPRYKTRWKHYHRFAKMVKDAGAQLVTIEAAFGERTHAIDELESDISVQVRTSHELWIKENLINLAVERLPKDWKYVAWIDADVAFARPNWVGETIHQLQHYKFLQMFSYAQDVGPDYNPLGRTRVGFVQLMQDGGYVIEDDVNYYGARGATGLAWAARRDAIDAVGGLMDFCILGSADWHMAHALFGSAEQSYPEGLSREYVRRIGIWQDLAERHIRRNVGVMSGLLLHYFHGKKVNRKYSERWKVLVDNQYSPSTDIKRDWQGVYQLEDHGDLRSIALRDGIRRYFRERNEDGTDV